MQQLRQTQRRQRAQTWQRALAAPGRQGWETPPPSGAAVGAEAGPPAPAPATAEAGEGAPAATKRKRVHYAPVLNGGVYKRVMRSTVRQKWRQLEKHSKRGAGVNASSSHVLFTIIHHPEDGKHKDTLVVYGSEHLVRKGRPDTLIDMPSAAAFIAALAARHQGRGPYYEQRDAVEPQKQVVPNSASASEQRALARKVVPEQLKMVLHLPSGQWVCCGGVLRWVPDCRQGTGNRADATAMQCMPLCKPPEHAPR